MYILDTDACIYLLNRRYPDAERRLRRIGPGDPATTTITVAELRFGALNSARPEGNLVRAEIFFAPLLHLSFDDDAATHFALIRHDLKSPGGPIGITDLLIASIARAADGILVTNNVRKLGRVPGLKVENWFDSR
ncbi:MAG: type II toxin-antitoxin system VapC family toxin [Acidobacteria bacterium]|nr:type II toxin-antitoxin system VapC family toxin [Acidobacteriota bacterium]